MRGDHARTGLAVTSDVCGHRTYAELPKPD